MERPSLTLGIEEEYLLVDPETRNLVAEPTPWQGQPFSLRLTLPPLAVVALSI